MPVRSTASRHSRAPSLEIFATCPPSKDFPAADYAQKVVDVAQWSEAAGCTGILVYTDNGIVDPWLVSHIIVENTDRVCPLVAVQPVYMHPYNVAKMVASFAFLHHRRLYLNMLAGGFRGDLNALDDPTPHDERYARLTEYTLIIRALLEHHAPVSFEGRYYTLRNLRLRPQIPPELMPGILMSGSSPAGAATAQATGATSIIYPRPAKEEADANESPTSRGVRIGIIARRDSEEAWRVARLRFPDRPRGRLAHKLAMKVSDSVWHRQLSEMEEQPNGQNASYWLRPFQTHSTFCPYLIGGYNEVAEHLRLYMVKGYRTFILDVPYCSEDLETARFVFGIALERSCR